jgi:predicted ferric reductase
VTAFVALALDVTFGLFLSTGAADRWISRARSVDVHRWLSSVTLVLVATHVLLLMGDGFVRFDVLDALVPFIAPYRPTAVALGVFATYLVIVVQVSFQLRHRIGTRTWRRLHHLTFVVFVLTTAHGVLAGSDTHMAWMRGVYFATAIIAAVLLLLRGRAAWIDRARATA